MTLHRDTTPPDAIAVVGLSGRFPGAENIEQFWNNLVEGRESITFFSDDELLSMGVAAEKLQDPTFVKAEGVISGIDLFDASFFGYNPREAALMDPQHRVFLECAWHAMEDAGCDPTRCEGRIGVYAGVGVNKYHPAAQPSHSPEQAATAMETRIGNDKDYLASRVSYKLNLKGPSIAVQTACSTSLVAVSLAYQSLLTYQCDLALAGGVSLNLPSEAGYYYLPDGILSADGHCRAFDATAGGTVVGSGAGVVALKRLEDALANRDSVHAVIRIAAMNNDGAAKVSFAAPSVDGQCELIAESLALAGINADSIRYVEAHGTGTRLGDPIEVAALTRAYRMSTEKSGYCAIGSVKSNIGHLDTAAGVAGLIKTILAVKHGTIPPSLHYRDPNPEIDFEHSPFYVDTVASSWPASDGPRRAGVSSFGIGGTNAHVIVEEARVERPPREDSGWQVLPLSARTPEAASLAARNLAGYLRDHGDIRLADVAYTLQAGRRQFHYRYAVAGQNHEDAAQRLEAAAATCPPAVVNELQSSTVAFLFPGGGTQYVGMGRGLYERNEIFRREFDHGAALLEQRCGLDLRARLQAAPGGDSSLTLVRPSIALPALFLTEYALAQLWISMGVRPAAMIGHSLGEYVAACVAGVVSLDDALMVVKLRGELFERLPEGAMLSVACCTEILEPLLGPSLSVAAINGPDQCAVAGPRSDITQLQTLLAERGVDVRPIPIDAASHSSMVEPILPAFAAFLNTLRFYPPAVPYVSNVTGDWITPEQATNPSYWVDHLRHTVRFSQGIATLLDRQGLVLLEVGPGQTLSSLSRQHPAFNESHSTVPSLRHPRSPQPDDQVLSEAVSRLWTAGVPLDWEQLHAGQDRWRVPLPPYAYQRQRYWLSAPGHAESSSLPLHGGLQKRGDERDWLFVPSWRRSPLPQSLPSVDTKARYLLFIDEHGLGRAIAHDLRALLRDVVTVRAGDRFEVLDEGQYVINPRRVDDYRRLIREATEGAPRTVHIVHCWSIDSAVSTVGDPEAFDRAQRLGYGSLVSLAQALTVTDREKSAARPTWRILVVTNHVFTVTDDDLCIPEKATLLGPCRVLPQEDSQVSCSCIDITLPSAATGDEQQLVSRIVREVHASRTDPVVAYRGRHRWTQEYVRVEGEQADGPPVLRPHGTYLISGGLGEVALALAREIAQAVQASLILIGRTRIPDRDQWAEYLAAAAPGDIVSQRIRGIQEIEQAGGRVLVLAADVSNEDDMRRALQTARNEFGSLHGVIHAAVDRGESFSSPLELLDEAATRAQFLPKVHGVYTLDRCLGETDLDFCVLFSSIASLLGGIGMTAYAAANCFLDAYATWHNRRYSAPWLSINWDVWAEHRAQPARRTSVERYAMTATEGYRAFRRALNYRDLDQLVVSTGDLQARINLWVHQPQLEGSDPVDTEEKPSHTHQRPHLSTPYVAPRTEIERMVAEIWADLLGLGSVGIHDDFFELGGHSLVGTRIMSRLRELFNISISLHFLFQSPTVEGLSVAIVQAQADEVDAGLLASLLAELAELPDEEAAVLLMEA